MRILGVNCLNHDAAISVIEDGEILFAAQSERYSRVKNDSLLNDGLVSEALSYGEPDLVAYYEKPIVKKTRQLYAGQWKEAFTLTNMPNRHLNQWFDKYKIHYVDHHESHAASAFYPSPYKEAVILTIDGVGEWSTTTISIGNNHNIEVLKEIKFPHSLGLLYSAFTYYLGFKVNSGEYKLMGLAPYGNPIFEDKIKQLIDIKDDGTFRLDQRYFNYATGLTMTNEKFNNLFGQKPRNPKNEKINQFHMDLAASIQKVTEEVMINLAKSIHKEYGIKNLCLAGGVALNCVANGKILREKIFENIWIQPAAGDAGGSLGAALALWHIDQGNKREVNLDDDMKGSYLGTEYTQEEIEQDLKNAGANFETLKYDELIDQTAEFLSNEKAVGWFQGRMEFGPRALGGRSILGDPRSDKMQKNLNLKVKYRESFRPFAPSIINEEVSNWFETKEKSPYMLLVANVKKIKQIEMNSEEKNLFGIDKLNIKRSSVPAITHVDYSSRIQTVHKETNPRFYKLINAFKNLTGCPILVNTSFNIRGEPIVGNVEDAFKCFMGTNLDILVCENFILFKDEQDKKLINDYSKDIELD